MTIRPYFRGMSIAKRYIAYRRRAINRHGVHSPFVYDLIEKVFRKKHWENKAAIKNLRKQLLKNHTEIEVEDLGAGSRVDNNRRRKVSKIAKVSATPFQKSAMLQRLVDFMNYKTILELGTNLGLTTAVLASAKANPKIVSIEGAPELAAIAVKNLEKLNLKAEIIVGSFEDTLDLALGRFEKLDMAYIDGNHRKDATLEYCNAVIDKMHNDSVLIIGDIHWSEGMEEAWKLIKVKPEVRVTIDLFDMGLVFFRKEMTPEHYTIYYS